MPGTSHFGRMDYNVQRGLREIVAPSHRLSKLEFEAIKAEFGGCCAYCGEPPSAANRGIVADHVIAVVEFGELLPGNILPSCQTCNDSRGKRDWRTFVRARAGEHAVARIAAIEAYLAHHAYTPGTPETSLTSEELAEYEDIKQRWGELLRSAQSLRSRVEKRRRQGRT